MAGGPPSAYSATVEVLHRVAAHVMGRRRFEVSGRFGLRATPGGFGTPAFGPDPEVVRLAGGLLVHEAGGVASWVRVDGSSLRELARFAGADIDADFSCGDDTPEVGDPDAPLRVDRDGIMGVAEWYGLGWRVLDAVVGGLAGDDSATTVQIWPEHFDAATTVTLSGGDSVNIGFSPGDGYEQEPYLYVGPWSTRRPGGTGYWNAPFGAVLRRSQLDTESDPAQACGQFVTRGLLLLES
jgi:hypothetical protein